MKLHNYVSFIKLSLPGTLLLFCAEYDQLDTCKAYVLAGPTQVTVYRERESHESQAFKSSLGEATSRLSVT